MSDKRKSLNEEKDHQEEGHNDKKQKSEPQIKLYSYFRSSCSWRVRIVLNLKGLKYDYIPVHLVKKHQIEESFVKLNPSKEVPALIYGDQVLAQSVAIMEFLEETYPDQNPILPKSPVDRAKVRQIVQVICSDTQPIQNLRVLEYVGDEKKMEWAKHWITWNFEALEKILSEVSGKYCFGDSLTMADACLVPQVFNANRFSVDMSKFPTISRINETLSLLQPFIDAHASNQPDSQ